MPIILIVLFITSVIPVFLAVLNGYLRYKEFGKFDNHYPRIQQLQQKGIGARVLAAQNNSWETLQVFLLVTFIAFASPINLHSLTIVSFVFLLSRIAHAICYIANYCWVRSTFYGLGMGCCMYIFYMSVVSY